jgi:hypothetical protein
MTTEQKAKRYNQWVRNRRALSILLGQEFEEPIKEDGSYEDNIDVLWDFYIDSVKRQMAEIAQQLEKEGYKVHATTTQS